MTGTSPVTVGTYRGILLGLFVAVVGAAGVGLAALTPLDLGDLGWAGPVVVVLGRALEAWALDRKAGPQAGALGGAPAVVASPGAPPPGGARLVERPPPRP